jgi:hypothetical protein
MNDVFRAMVYDPGPFDLEAHKRGDLIVAVKLQRGRKAWAVGYRLPKDQGADAAAEFWDAACERLKDAADQGWTEKNEG